MDTKLQILAITFACIVILLPAAEAQAAKDCKADIVGLMSCMPAIRDTKPIPDPTNECCNALKSSDLPCICSRYRNSPYLKELVSKPDVAKKVLGKCKVAVPSECH